MRQSEDRMVMAHRKQFRLTVEKPPHTYSGRAARTKSMAARVVKNAVDMAVRTTFYVTSEGGGMTHRHHAHCLPNVGG